MEETENVENGPVPKADDSANSQGKSCALCGCSTPAVRCDRCSSQMFCLSCDDMYHKHPKRRLHLRKAVDSIWNSARSPRLRRHIDLPGDPSKIPIPPPRTKKRERHTIGGRIFLKSGLELGSFGHSRMFDLKDVVHPQKDFSVEQKSPAHVIRLDGENGVNVPGISNDKLPEPSQIYENESVAINEDQNVNGSNIPENSPWNASRPNISSPIQVSIPSGSPDMLPSGQSFGYPAKPHSQSAADLTGASVNTVGHHPYHFPHPYPFMQPPMHPPYSHSMAHLNCAQCLSSSWSNLMSPHPSPYFHPMPWGSAQSTLARNQQMAAHGGQVKHSHGDLISYPDSGFHYPYPGGAFYTNGPPPVDPNFVKELHQHAELKKSPPASRASQDEENAAAADSTADGAASDVALGSPNVSTRKAFQSKEEEEPKAPEKPTEPWSCLHCTFINPAGIFVCQVCCKTSYGNVSSAEEENEAHAIGNRDSESPMELINRDAFVNSEFSEHKEAQKDTEKAQSHEIADEVSDVNLNMCNDILAESEPAAMLTTETQTSTTTKSTDVQTQNLLCKSMASSTDSIFPKQEISVQTEIGNLVQNCSVATDPMISSQSMESLLSGVSAPPYHNRRAGWGRGATSFSTQSLYERGRSRSPMPRSASMYNEAHSLGKESNLPPEEVMNSWREAWLMSDPMYYKPHNLHGFSQMREDYFDGTWGSMDKLNRRVQGKQEKSKYEIYRRPRFHRSLDDLKSDKKPEIPHSQEILFLQTVKEADRCGFSLEDLHVAYLHCGKEDPVFWLEDNWPPMIKNVISLAAKYGEDNEENDVGVITASEAKEALRIHRGDIWDAVTECIENRQRKILELTVRGNFTQKQIAEALKNNEGNVELAFADLVRASNRRHKFILSPGLSEDSEDLSLYNPVDDSTLDHTTGHLPKAGKLDISVESKTEKKKSDFLTKLSTIRQTQSERRKAREEKELIRESIVQDFPVSSEGEAMSPQAQEMPVKLDESLKIVHQESTESGFEMEPKDTTVYENKVESDTQDQGAVEQKQKTDDIIPEDFDANWVDSQGEWIEEYSDEQWDEGDGQWVTLEKKYHKLEKELEEEAMQMAALWEKEELEDEVFEDDTKEVLQPVQQSEMQSPDEKFEHWVKVNLEKNLSEPEEEQPNEEMLNDSGMTEVILKEGPEFEAIKSKSPLQHYPTEFDLSSKSLTEPDWVNLPSSAKNEQDMLLENKELYGRDYENQSKSPVMNIKEDIKTTQDYSDEEWEKIGFEQLQELNEQEKLLSVENDAVNKTSSEFSEEKQIIPEDEMKLNDLVQPDFVNVGSEAEVNIYSNTHANEELPIESFIPTEESSDYRNYDIGDETNVDKLYAQPKPPVRRRSKLNTAAIEEVLKNQPEVENTDDIPPAIPIKIKNKDVEQSTQPDMPAVPEKIRKTEPANVETPSFDEQDGMIVEPVDSRPVKPPRMNLATLQSIEMNEEGRINLISSKEASPVTSLSNESDSNCFADSESDEEIRAIRQKIHRKTMKYENELEDFQEDTHMFKTDKLIDEAEAETITGFELPHAGDVEAKDIDYDPELPIPVGMRGSRISEFNNASLPKAFREDTTRPLQLFKVVKQESSSSAVLSASADSEDKTLYANDHINLDSNKTVDIMQTYQNDNQIITAVSLDKPEMHSEVLDTSEVKSEQQFVPSWSKDESQIQHSLENISQEPETEDLAFTEMEGMSAAVDYFFGRYNEVTVTRPKKKTAVRSSKPATASPKAMSASEIIAPSKPEISPDMNQSVIPSPTSKTKQDMMPEKIDLITSQLQSNVVQDSPAQIESIKEPITSQTISETDSVITTSDSKPVTPSVEHVAKESSQTEYLSFAEDYFFGSYNEVVVPKKGKKKTSAVQKSQLPAIPPFNKLHGSQEQVASQTKSLAIDKKLVLDSSSMESYKGDSLSEIPENDDLIFDADVPSSDPLNIEQSLSGETISTDIQFESDSVNMQSIQQGGDSVQGDASMNQSVKTGGVKAKTVHFEEPQIPIAPPPRRHKLQNGQKAQANITEDFSKSYAEEYLFGQYGDTLQDKKKLLLNSEDFKMKSGCELSVSPFENLPDPGGKLETVLSSEISTEIPKETLKFHEITENNENIVSCEQLMSSDIKVFDIDKGDTSNEYPKDTALNHSDIIITEGTDSCNKGFKYSLHDSESNERLVTETEISESPQDFQQVSTYESPSSNISEAVQSEQDTKDKSFGSQFDENTEVESISEPNLFTVNAVDSSIIHSASTVCVYEQAHFPLIEQLPHVSQDTCSLYYSQDSFENLENEMKSLALKSNIEETHADDSEQEWKLNEERNNSLNASFIKSNLSCHEDSAVIFDEAKLILDNDQKTIVCTGEFAQIEESDLVLKSDELHESEAMYVKYTEKESNIVKPDSDSFERDNIVDSNIVLPLTALSHAATADQIPVTSDSFNENEFGNIPSDVEQEQNPSSESNSALDVTQSEISSSHVAFSDASHDKDYLDESFDDLNDLADKVVEQHVYLSDTEFSGDFSDDALEQLKYLEDSSDISSSMLDQPLSSDLSQDVSFFTEEENAEELDINLDSEDMLQNEVVSDIAYFDEADDLNDFSDDSVASSTHSSVSTQITVSCNVLKKEISVEGHDVLEPKYSQNDDSDVSVIAACLSLCLSKVEENLSDIGTSDELEGANTSLESEKCDEFTATFESNKHDFIAEIDSFETRQNHENGLHETVSDEVQANEVNDDSCLSLMSHFYEEWFENVQPLSQHVVPFDIRTAYASYSYSESSESSNDNDENNFPNLSQDVVFIEKESVENRNICEENIKSDTAVQILQKGNDSEYQISGMLDTDSQIELTAVHDFTKEDICDDDAHMVYHEDFSKEYNDQKDQALIQDTDESICMTSDFVESRKITDETDNILKFNTSKSCQTEDSFEEDVFFDSFDDTFTVPSFLNIPVVSNGLKPTKTEIGIQCDLISTNKVSSVIEISESSLIQKDIDTKQSQGYSSTDIVAADKGDSQTEAAVEDKEESSCESFEDSDSDLFIDSHSSHDELTETSRKPKGLLYAEVDSDTGFSSGSDSGKAKQAEKETKLLKKGQISSLCEEKSFVVDSIERTNNQAVVSLVNIVSEDVSSASLESYVKKETMQEKYFSVDDDVIASTEKKLTKEGVHADDASEKSEKEKHESSNILECVSKISDMNQVVSNQIKTLSTVVERAITPVTIERLPLEDDLKFIEMESTPETPEEFVDASHNEDFNTVPTVEYFYGPLPDTVSLEPQLESNESMFEVASEYFETAVNTQENNLPRSPVSTDNLDVKGKHDQLCFQMEDSLLVDNDDFIDTCSSFSKVDISEQFAHYDDKTKLEVTEDESEAKEDFVLTSEKSLCSDLSVPIEKLDELDRESIGNVPTSSPEVGSTCGVKAESSVVSDEHLVKYPEMKESLMSIEEKSNMKHFMSDESEEKEAFECISAVEKAKPTSTEASNLEHVCSAQEVIQTTSPNQFDNIEHFESIDATVCPAVETNKSSECNLCESISEYFPAQDSSTVTNATLFVSSDDISSGKSDIPEIVSDLQTTDGRSSFAFTDNSEKPDEYLKRSKMETSQAKEVKDSTLCEIPEVPSDIVRYLYYDDEISFHQSNEISSDTVDSAPCPLTIHQASISEISESSAVSLSSESQFDSDNNYEMPDNGNVEKLETDVTSAQNINNSISDNSSFDNCSSIYQSTFEGDVLFKQISDIPQLRVQSNSKQPLDIHAFESSEKWFDIDVDKSSVSQEQSEKFLDFETHSLTKSSNAKDDIVPCIPEYILGPEMKQEFSGTKVDSDEITDISTHFTMTDDSDKFSDIESDTSLENIDDYPSGVKLSDFGDAYEEVIPESDVSNALKTRQIKLSESTVADNLKSAYHLDSDIGESFNQQTEKSEKVANISERDINGNIKAAKYVSDEPVSDIHTEHDVKEEGINIPTDDKQLASFPLVAKDSSEDKEAYESVPQYDDSESFLDADSENFIEDEESEYAFTLEEENIYILPEQDDETTGVPTQNLTKNVDHYFVQSEKPFHDTTFSIDSDNFLEAQCHIVEEAVGNSDEMSDSESFHSEVLVDSNVTALNTMDENFQNVVNFQESSEELSANIVEIFDDYYVPSEKQLLDVTFSVDRDSFFEAECDIVEQVGKSDEISDSESFHSEIPVGSNITAQNTMVDTVEMIQESSEESTSFFKRDLCEATELVNQSMPEMKLEKYRDDYTDTSHLSITDDSENWCELENENADLFEDTKQVLSFPKDEIDSQIISDITRTLSDVRNIESIALTDRKVMQDESEALELTSGIDRIEPNIVEAETLDFSNDSEQAFSLPKSEVGDTGQVSIVSNLTLSNMKDNENMSVAIGEEVDTESMEPKQKSVMESRYEVKKVEEETVDFRGSAYLSDDSKQVFLLSEHKISDTDQVVSDSSVTMSGVTHTESVDVIAERRVVSKSEALKLESDLGRTELMKAEAEIVDFRGRPDFSTDSEEVFSLQKCKVDDTDQVMSDGTVTGHNIRDAQNVAITVGQKVEDESTALKFKSGMQRMEVAKVEEETVDFRGAAFSDDSKNVFSMPEHTISDSGQVVSDSILMAHDVKHMETVDFSFRHGVVSKPETLMTKSDIERVEIKAETEIVDFRGNPEVMENESEVSKLKRDSEKTGLSEAEFVDFRGSPEVIENESKLSILKHSIERTELKDETEIVDFRGPADIAKSSKEVLIHDIHQVRRDDFLIESNMKDVKNMTIADGEKVYDNSAVLKLKSDRERNEVAKSEEETVDFRGALVMGSSYTAVENENEDLAMKGEEKACEHSFERDHTCNFAEQASVDVIMDRNDYTFSNLEGKCEVVSEKALHSALWDDVPCEQKFDDDSRQKDDISSEFYSLSENDDTLNFVSSDDFTDVPSHMTLTEDSDKWSDVEADLPLDDTGFRNESPMISGINVHTPTHEAMFSFVVNDNKIEEPLILESSKVYSREEKSEASEVYDREITLQGTLERTSLLSESAYEYAFQEYIEQQGEYISQTEASADVHDSFSQALSSEISGEQYNFSSFISTCPDDTTEGMESLESNYEQLCDDENLELFDTEQEQLFKINYAEAISAECFPEMHSECENISSSEISESIPFESVLGGSSALNLDEACTDTTSYNTFNEENDKWSDVENDLSVHDLNEGDLFSVEKISAGDSYSKEFSNLAYESEKLLDSESYAESVEKQVAGLSTEKKSEIIVSEQTTSLQSEMSLKLLEDSNSRMQSESLSLQKSSVHTEPEGVGEFLIPFTEHFADIKSLNEQLSVVDTFNTFDSQTAVPKMHEDATELSLPLERTDGSECWLEAETDYSVSEFEEDFVSTPEKAVFLDSKEMKIDYIEPEETSFENLDKLNYTRVTTQSSSNDQDSSDHMSDTFADISLQGATTESSDKWSDIEAEALIDDVLYGTSDLKEAAVDASSNVSDKEFGKVDQNCSLSERDENFNVELKLPTPYNTSATEGILISEVEKPLEIKQGEPISDVLQNISEKEELTEERYLCPVSQLTASHPTSGILEGNVLSLEGSQLSLLVPSETSIGLSDEELTNVTPMDVTNEETDKWSDISSDTSVEEIDESSISISLKVDSDNVAVSERQHMTTYLHEKSEGQNAQSEETMILSESCRISKEFSEEVSRFPKLSDETSATIDTEQKFDGTIIAKDSKSDHERSEFSSIFIQEKSEPSSFLARVHPSRVVRDQSQSIQLDSESASTSVHEGAFETYPEVADVLSSTTTDVSDVLCEEGDGQPIDRFTEGKENEEENALRGTNTSKTSFSANESSDNHIEELRNGQEYVDDSEGFNLNFISEKDLDEYEQQYPLEHFEISEDELIYPLPYDDWIEQSFELKEYGIETAASDYDSDIHGYGIINEEYDDEDIQRAIDFNISNFEDEKDADEEHVAADSFKTLSNDISPHAKTTDKEYDSWSTADAPSIEEDFPEHDEMLSRIDELLAEDFTFEDVDAYDHEGKDESGIKSQSYKGRWRETYDFEESKELKMEMSLEKETSKFEDHASVQSVGLNVSVEHRENTRMLESADLNQETSESQAAITFEMSSEFPSSRTSVKDGKGSEKQSMITENVYPSKDISSKDSVPEIPVDPSDSALHASILGDEKVPIKPFLGEFVQKADNLTKETVLFTAADSKEVNLGIMSEENDDARNFHKKVRSGKEPYKEHSSPLISPEKGLFSSKEEAESKISIPSKSEESSQPFSEEIADEVFIVSPKSETEVTLFSALEQSSELSSVVTDTKPNIPVKRKSKPEVSELSSFPKPSSDSETCKVKESDSKKPDIPVKRKSKSPDVRPQELKVQELDATRPSLPPKKKKHSSSSESFSFSDSLHSSSESLSSFESVSSKADFKPSDVIPDVPLRKSKSPKLSSASTKSEDSDDGSSSSSLKSRRRRSNFMDDPQVLPSLDLSQKRTSIDERMFKLQSEGKCTNKEAAFIAAKLIEMQFEEDDALLASKQCSSVYHAIKFLTQLCELCNCRFPINLMASMVHCTHRACKECLRAHFTPLIYDRSVFTLLCPICHKPDITDQNIQEYFNHLDMMLRNILEEKVYDLFQRKLRDEVLTKDPNFHWCSQCSSGFIASPRLKKLYCPDCSAITCALCHQTWELEHEGVHCERFQQWKDMHTPEPPPAGLVKFLTDRGIKCPSCGIVYAQACGGCLMYKCSHCSFEFCGFCTCSSKRPKDCLGKPCESQGVHMHHTYDCLYFMRDKDISDLQLLLEEESITYLTIPPKDQIVKSRCQVREQKHIHGVLSEDRCGRSIEPYCAGLCRIHYHEYLAEILRMKKVDVLSIMTTQDLQFMLRKSRIFVPERVKGESNEDYYMRILKVVSSTLT